MGTEATATKDKLVQDLKTFVNDVEDMLRAGASGAADKVALARERLQDSMRAAKTKMAEYEDVIVHRAKQTADATDEYVHENPWRAVGIAAGLGLVIGLLIGRR